MKKALVFLFAVALASAALGAVHTVGGTGYTGNAIPWWGSSYTAMRFQCCWYQSEINEAGNVTKIEFQISSVSGTTPATFSNVTMLLCHTTATALTSTFADNYTGNTPVTVYTGTFVLPSGLVANDWVVQCSPTNFVYNNTNNLLFEITWSGVSPATTAYFWRANVSQPGRVYATNNTATTGTVYANQGEIARITITPNSGVTPSSLGRVKSMFQ